MKLELLAIHYLGEEKARRLRAPAGQSSLQKGQLRDLNALTMSAVELALVCDPIHECKQNSRCNKS